MRRLPALIALALLAPACTFDRSEVAPEADVSIGGRALREDGSPVAGARLTLVRHEDVGEAFTAVFSLGLACVADDRALTVCKGGRVATTRGDGRFAFTVKGRDTQGFLGQASTLEIGGALPRGDRELAGPGSAVRFQVQTERLDLALKFWGPRVSASSNGPNVHVRFTDPPATLVPAEAPLDATLRHVRFERTRAEVVWVAPAVETDATLDSRLLEDSRGSLSVVAEWRGVEVSDERGRAVDLVFRSARIPYRGTAGKPPSRGASCSARGAGGGLTRQNPCRLTDGAFAEPWTPKTCPPSQTPCVNEVREALVDLGESRDAQLVVVRGCPGECFVDASADGRQWTTIGASSDEPDIAFAAGNPPAARFVRVRSDRNLETLREISVWERGITTVAPFSIIAEVGGLLPRFSDVVGGPGRAAPIAAAALLVALLAGALGATALARRTR